MRQRFLLSISMTLLLTFTLQDITDALIPEAVVPQDLKLRTSEPIREEDTVSIATKDDITISEIMCATDTSGSPQWIELHNRSARRVSLEGWEVTIENHPEDRSVLSTKLTLTLDEKILDANQMLLLVTEQGDNSGVGVELSHFRPARSRDTGVVVITWSTLSELSNAGFFIKRSYQRDGEFKIINATIIPGAGTTSEKQFYTYTDTTARPNVVYYYQLECVSVDGTRQTLTRPIRLKGHIGNYGRFEEAPFWWKDLNR